MMSSRGLTFAYHSIATIIISLKPTKTQNIFVGCPLTACFVMFNHRVYGLIVTPGLCMYGSGPALVRKLKGPKLVDWQGRDWCSSDDRKNIT